MGNNRHAVSHACEVILKECTRTYIREPIGLIVYKLPLLFIKYIH